MKMRLAITIAAALAIASSAAFAQDQDQTTPKVVKPATAPRATVAAETTDQQVPPPPPPPPPASTKVTAQPYLPMPGGALQTPKVQLRPAKGQPLNIKVEFTITDQVGSKPPTKKTVMATIADAADSRIRSTVTGAVKRGSNWDMRNSPLSVDISPTVEGSKIRVEFALEYNLNDEPTIEGAPSSTTQVSERLAVLLNDGVSAIVAQAMDPMTDRKVTVEVKATILK